MRPCKVYAQALDLIRAFNGDITPNWVQQTSGLTKQRSWWALRIAFKKGLIQRTGHGVYRRPTTGAA